MQITLSEKLSREIALVAQEEQLSVDDLLEESLAIYKDFLRLRSEWNLWERASDEDLLRFERDLDGENLHE